jgi:hypothetical protein
MMKKDDTVNLMAHFIPMFNSNIITEMWFCDTATALGGK